MNGKKKAPFFNERAATQVAGELLRLRGGTMKFLKLIKLMYLVEREALVRWGDPITRDRLVAMPKGQVLSKTYDLIREELEPGCESYWKDHITDPDQKHDITMRKEIPGDELSPAVIQLIKDVFGKFGRLNRFRIVHLLHELPEWNDPDGSSYPISYRTILEGAGKTPEEADRITKDIEYFDWVQEQFS